MKFIKLGEIVNYSTDRIACDLLSSTNYVGVDNILPSKNGKKQSTYVPNIGNCIKYIKNDILIANIRPYLKKIWFSNDFGGCSGDVSCLRITNNNFDSKYIYYCLLQDAFFDYAMLGAKQGSRMPRLDKTQILSFRVANIPKQTQQKIAAILSSLDDKIETNNKIASVLEKMMKEIYHYWFVQFDFPDKNGKPYQASGGEMVYNPTLKREIPKGWEVGKLKDFLEVKTGKKDANFSTKNGKYAFFTCGDETLKCDEFEFEGKSILLAGNGNFNVKYYDGKFNAYQRTYVLIPKDEKYFGTIYISVLNRVEALTKGATGSIIKFITKGDVENIPVIFNYNNDSFLHIVNSFLTMQNELKKQTQTLTALRDFLLPLLMNGQASVQ